MTSLLGEQLLVAVLPLSVRSMNRGLRHDCLGNEAWSRPVHPNIALPLCALIFVPSVILQSVAHTCNDASLTLLLLLLLLHRLLGKLSKLSKRPAL
mmetsp:Transcript_32957/g.65555  ORF Transcript_32957/g.65555 Transcript_32957/m.65555 type:complete len:96 (-) Transcript_32957:363-650(-)